VTTRHERYTGKLIGPRFHENPWLNWKRRKRVVAPEPEPVSDGAARELEKIQAARPLKPPTRSRP